MSSFAFNTCVNKSTFTVFLTSAKNASDLKSKNCVRNETPSNFFSCNFKTSAFLLPKCYPFAIFIHCVVTFLHALFWDYVTLEALPS